MSLIVYPYIRDPTTHKMEELAESPSKPFNELFGLESWRTKIWGSAYLSKFGCELLGTLRTQDIYAESEDLLQLKQEIMILKENRTQVCNNLGLEILSFESRLDNALEAIRIAQKQVAGGVFIG